MGILTAFALAFATVVSRFLREVYTFVILFNHTALGTLMALVILLLQQSNYTHFVYDSF